MFGAQLAHFEGLLVPVVVDVPGKVGGGGAQQGLVRFVGVGGDLGKDIYCSTALTYDTKIKL